MLKNVLFLINRLSHSLQKNIVGTFRVEHYFVSSLILQDYGHSFSGAVEFQDFEKFVFGFDSLVLYYHIIIDVAAVV